MFRSAHKLTSELVITKKVNSRIEERIINLEKNSARTIDIFGVSVRICKGKGRFTMSFI